MSRLSRAGRRPGAPPERGLVGKGVLALLVLALLVLAAIEAGSIALTRLRLEQVARAAASSGAAVFDATRDADRALRAARQASQLAHQKASISRFKVNPANGRVTVTVTTVAATILLHRVRSLAGYAVVRATSSSPPP